MSVVARAIAFVSLAGFAACGQAGAVTFSVVAPGVAAFDPLGERVTDYSLRTSTGTVIGVSTAALDSSARLPLGPLLPSPVSVDVTLTLLSASQLVGMGRVLNVSIVAGKQSQYSLHVRKPLIYIGTTLPPEEPVDASPPVTPVLGDGQVFDPTTSRDLSDIKKLPRNISASAVTTDGRFLLAGHDQTLAVIDTGTGELLGERELGFVAARIRVAARDAYLAVLDAQQAKVVVFPDVATLVSSPASARFSMTPIVGAPRDLRFAPDGTSLYVLTGGMDVDPCDSSIALPANELIALDPAATTATPLGSWTFDNYVSAIAVDPSSGNIVLSEQAPVLLDGNRQPVIDPRTGKAQYDLVRPAGVATLDSRQPFGRARTARLFTATCPSALAVSNGKVLVATAERDKTRINTFLLLRANRDGSELTQIPVKAPSFEGVLTRPIDDVSTFITFQAEPSSIAAYEISVTPDGSRTALAVRTGYRVTDEHLRLALGDRDCFANLQGVEYGLYKLDTGVGTTAYEMHSLLVLSDQRTNPCLLCPGDLFNPTFSGACVSSSGDRASGLSAIFEAP